jgi:2-octaprenyl-6-methoxyphenol hydroxylase
MDDQRVTIIGGGPVGAAFACALAEQKISSRIIDRTPLGFFLSDENSDCRAIALSPSSKNFLEHLGIWQSIKNIVCPIDQVKTVHGPTNTSVRFDPSASDPLGYIIPLSLLRQKIAQRVKTFADRIEWVEGTLGSLEKQGPFITVHLNDGRFFKSSILVGADGKGSFVRKLGAFETIEHPYGKDAIVCTYEHKNNHENIAWEIFREDGPLALLPMTHNRSSLVWSVDHTIAESLREASDEDFDQILSHELSPYLEQPKRVSPRWIYPLSLQFVDHSAKEGIFLIGDAAHVIHPLAGQGVNLGLRDAGTLAEVLIEGAQIGLSLSDSTICQKYERWRRFDVFSMILATDGLEALFSNHNPLIKKMRDIGLKMVDRNKGLKRLLSKSAMGTLGNLPWALKEKVS